MQKLITKKELLKNSTYKDIFVVLCRTKHDQKQDIVVEEEYVDPDTAEYYPEVKINPASYAVIIPFYDLATVCNCDLGNLQNIVQDCFDMVFEHSAFFTEEEILKYESVFNKEYTVSDVREVLQNDKDFKEFEITDMHIVVVTIDTSTFIENIKNRFY